MTRREFVAAAAVLGGSAGLPFLSRAATAAPPQPAAPPRPLLPLKVIVFPGGFNLPLWIAQEKGFLAAQNLPIEITFTPGSVFQLTRLIAGEFDLAITAIDNLIAYDEGQGEVPVSGRPDLFAFMGGDNGFLRLITRPEIKTYADLRGKKLSVDAVTTGYAFVLRAMLEAHDLKPGDYEFVSAGGVLQRWEALLKGEHAGTLLITPFEILARQRGFTLLQSAIEVLHNYQGLVGAARRTWAASHSKELTGFIRAYRGALQWLYSPFNRDEAMQILARKANFPPALAADAYAVLVDPYNGFAPAASMDFVGIRTVLALRSRYAAAQKTLSNPLKYVDLRYYFA